MSANTMLLLFNCLIIFILLSGVFVGIFRGGKKTIFKVVTTVIFYIILFATIDYAAEFIVEQPLMELVRKAGVKLPDYLSGARTIEEACFAFLVAQGIEGSELIKVAMALSIVISKLVYCVLFFTIIAFVYWILTSIVWVLIRPLFGGKYKVTKKYKYDHYEKTKELRSKHRLIGGCFGFVKKIPQALLVIIMTTGIINTLPEMNMSSTKQNLNSADINDDQLKSFIEKYNLGEFVKFVDMYRNTVYVNTLEKVEIGGESVVDKVFDKLTSGEYKDYRLDLSSEMAFILSTGVKVLNITGDNFDFNTYTALQQQQLVEVLKDITNSELLMSLIPISVDIALSLKMVKEKLPEGLELNPAIFNNVDWEKDITNICDTAIELIELTDGLQNIKDLDYLHLDPKIVNNLANLVSRTSFLLTIVPPLVDYVLQLDKVQNMIGDLVVSLDNILWSQEIITMGDIYEKFIAIGISSFEDIFGQIQNFEDQQFESTKTLISSIFTSEFVSQVFPGVFNIMMSQQPDNVKQLFQDVQINEWENEFITLVDLAKEIKESGSSFDKIDLNIIKSVSVDTILRSDLLTHGMINIFTTMEEEGSIGQEMGLDDFVYVPLSYRSKVGSDYGKWFESVDSDNNVVHGELYKILKGIQNVIKTLPKEEVDLAKLPEYILKINDSYLDSENEENKDQAIFNSIVLKASISKLLNSNETIKESIVIPSDAVTKVDDIDVINQVEIEKMVKGIKALGIEDFNNINLTSDLIANLENQYDGDINKKNIDVILESKIVNLTLTNLLDKKTIETGGNFVIPADAKENYTIKDINGNSYNLIKQSEIRKVVTAFTKVDIDLNNPQFDITLINKLNDQDLDVILDSKIINFNLTNKVLELGNEGGSLIIPNDESVINNGYINNQEIKTIIKALQYMNIDDFNNIVINNELLEKMMACPSGETENVLNIALNSKILSATLSDKLINVNPDNLVVPNEAKETNSYLDINNVKHNDIKKAEFENMITTILKLNINIANPQFSIDTILNLSDQDIDNMLKSKILHFNITKTISSNTTIVVPEDEVVISNGYVNPVEIKSLVKTLKVLGINDFESISIDKTLFAKLVKNAGEPNQDTTNIDNMLDSHILQATISNKIITSGKLAIPDDIKEVFGNKEQILKEELSSVVIAVAISDLNIDEFNLANIYELNNNGKLMKMLDSRILHYNISKSILDTSDGILVIPEDVVVNGYINENEISSIVKALEVLGVTDTVVELTPARLFGLLDAYETSPRTKLDVILDSRILHATLSKQILDINSLKIVRSIDVHYIDNNGTNYIAKTEINNALAALKEVIGTTAPSFDNMEFGPNNFKNKDLNTIFDSIILRSTVSDLIAKDTMIQEIREEDYCSHTVTTINKTEIINFINAFGENGLNITGSSFSDGIDANTVSKLTNAQLDVILSSKILHQKISNIILGLSNVIIVDSVVDKTTTTIYITTNEIKALINFAKGKGLNQITVSNEDVISLLSDKNLVENIKDSYIMRATFGEIAKNTTLIIPGIPSKQPFPTKYLESVKVYGLDKEVSILNDSFFADYGVK